MSFAENNNVSTRMNMSSWHTYHERNNLSKFHVNLFRFRATLAGFFFTGLRSVVILKKNAPESMLGERANVYCKCNYLNFLIITYPLKRQEIARSFNIQKK